MPVNGIALADSLQTTWINLTDLLGVLCVCASDSFWYVFWC